MIHTYGNCSFDDVDGTVYEHESSCDDFYDTEDHDNIDYEHPTDLDDDGELVSVSDIVKDLFGKE